MTEFSRLGFELPGFSGRKIGGNFEGGNVSSDGGLVLLRQVDRWIGLTKSLAKRLPDKRHPDNIEHSSESMLASAYLRVGAGVRRSQRSRLLCAKICFGRRRPIGPKN